MAASVDTLISSAQSYATGVLAAASTALSSANSAIQNVGYDQIFYSSAWQPQPPTLGTLPSAPVLGPVDLAFPDAPTGTLSFQDISAIEKGVAPTLSATVPTITMPTTPSQLAQFVENAPTINTSYVFPAPPSILSQPAIAEPTLGTYTIPTTPNVVVPAFTAVAPVSDAVAPTDLAAQYSAAFSEASPRMTAAVVGYVDSMIATYNPQFKTQMAAIEAQLSKYLAGGTGLNASVEQAIYERARSKNDGEARKVRETVARDAADRGFTMPPGAMNNALQQARQDAANNNAMAAREIVVIQAEMEQKNLQFAVTTSTGLRTAVLNASMMYMQNLTSLNAQALAYAKEIVSSLIEVYNAAVRAYASRVDAYRAEALVFETKLRSAMAGIELYKVQIEALSAMTNVDRAKVEVYRARIDALNSYANVYKAQIDAVLGQASLEKLKLEMFQSKVQTYVAQVQAKNSEWQGYTAAIEGETSKVKLYGAQVDSYNAMIQGYKAQIEAQSVAVNAQVATNRARADQYVASLDGYKAVVAAVGEKARSQVAVQNSQVAAYQVNSQASLAQAQATLEYYKTTTMLGLENSKFTIQAMLASAENKRKYGESLATLSVSTADVYKGLAGAALSGMNTLVSQSLTQ